MKVKIKKLHPDAVVPRYAKPGDAGLDFTATSMKVEDGVGGCTIYGTGLAVEIPPGHVGLLFPRSSLSNKALILTNHVGVIDSGYRGEIMFKFKDYFGARINRYMVGERIGQMLIIPYPTIEFEEVEELSDTERGSSGYGSTGN